MVEIKITFYGYLTDFFKNVDEKITRLVTIKRRSVKDFIESMGVPHTEVGRILVDGKGVDFTFIIQEKCYIEVYPFFLSDIDRMAHIQSEELRFICDVHIGTLARRLRLLGMDTRFDKNWQDEKLAEIAETQDRVLLTRDRHLLMRKNVTKGLYIRSLIPDIQVREVIKRFDLKLKCRPFTRCLVCNGLLISLDKNTDLFQSNREKIPPKVQAWCRNYSICRLCGKIYWEGTHFEKLKKMVNRYLS
ncbi:MAG: twitching motility protein PilT [Candidatus Aminicenantes bacterium]|nr:twitching motility protein PilT [Candidatus Aminicenantes bacterium]